MIKFLLFLIVSIHLMANSIQIKKNFQKDGTYIEVKSYDIPLKKRFKKKIRVNAKKKKHISRKKKVYKQKRFKKIKKKDNIKKLLPKNEGNTSKVVNQEKIAKDNNTKEEVLKIKSNIKKPLLENKGNLNKVVNQQKIAKAKNTSNENILIEVDGLLDEATSFKDVFKSVEKIKYY